MDEEVDLGQLFQTILKRGWMIVALTIVAMATAYVASMFMTPVYEAETAFMIKTSGSGLSLPFDDLGLMGSGQNVSRNYVELVKSRTIMEKAVARLNASGSSVGDADVEDLRKALSVQLVAQTDAIRVKVQLSDRNLATDLANAVVDVLIEHNREMNQAATRTAREYLAKQSEIADIQLREAEERALALKSGKKIVEPSAEAQAQIKRIVDLETQKAMVDMTIGESQARIGKLREQLSGISDTVVSSESTVEDPVVAGYRAKLADLEVALATARQRYTEQHPEVQKLVSEISEVKANLNSAVAKVVGTQVSTPNPLGQSLQQQMIQAETEMAAARAQAEALKKVIAEEEAKLSKLPEKELDLARVTRDLEVAQEIYLMLRTKYEEVRITEQMQISDIWRIDPAVTPEKPIKPRKMLNTAIAGVLGVFIGVGIAFVLEFTDTSLKSAEEVEALLGLPVLAAIPVHVGPDAERHNSYRNHPHRSSHNGGKSRRSSV